LLPDVPTFAELGHDRLDISLWYGIGAPAAPPTAVVQRLNGELVKILAMADIRKRLVDQGANVGGGTPADFAAFMNEERNRWGVVVREGGIKPE
jgi:tripartite-type tricarboxylate transporter receptor subunit TctC